MAELGTGRNQIGGQTGGQTGGSQFEVSLVPWYPTHCDRGEYTLSAGQCQRGRAMHDRSMAQALFTPTHKGGWRVSGGYLGPRPSMLGPCLGLSPCCWASPLPRLLPSVACLNRS